MINSTYIDGKIVTDVELRQSKAGTSVSDFRIVHHNRRSSSSTFVDIEVWGSEAERTYNHAVKGDRIVVEGELRQDNWETNDGQKRTKLKITASKVVLMKNINE